MKLQLKIARLVLALTLVVSNFAYFRPSDHPVFRKESSIHAHTARLLLDRDREETAIQELKRALNAHPGNRGISVKLAHLYTQRGRLDEALELLLPFQALSTRQSNVYYYIGLIYDKKEDFESAYVYYRKAFKLDPTRYKAKLRMAQLFIKKGLYFDAATHLKNLLEINPEYEPAQVEFDLTLRLIKENKNNIFRRGNLVITFPDYNLIRDIEEWYPYLQEKIYYMQNALGHHQNVVWVKVVPKITTHLNPPALYRKMENKIYLTVDTLKRKYTSLFAHELAYMFLHQKGLKNLPAWLSEGIAMYFAQPNLLKNLNLRRMRTGDDIFEMRFPQDKRFLHFTKLSQEDKLNLFQAFLFVKYLVVKYGWDNLEKFCNLFTKGKVRTEDAIWQVYHLPYKRLLAHFDMYLIRKHFFKS